jgi:hypothetical protein
MGLTHLQGNDNSSRKYHGKPPNSKADYITSAHFIWQKRLNDVYSLLRGGWDFKRGRYTVPGEKPVLHRNLVGTVDSGISNATYYYDDDDFPVTDPYEQFYVQHLGASSEYQEILPWKKPVPSATIKGIFDPLDDDQAALLEIGDFDDQSGTTSSGSRQYFARSLGSGVQLSFIWAIGWWSGSSWIFDLYPTRLTYTISTKAFTPNLGYVYDLDEVVEASVLFEECQPVRNTALPVTIDGYSIDEVINYFSFFLPNPFGDWTDEDYYSSSLTNGPSYFLSPPDRSLGLHLKIGVELATGSFTSSEPGTFLHFTKAAEQLFPSCASANFVSSQDAIDTHFGNIGTNHIETLVEIREIASPIGLVRSAKALVSKGISSNSLEGLLDLLADAKLTYAFGIAPTFQAAGDIAKKAKDLKRRITDDDLYKPSTAYGKVTYPLPADILPDYPGAVCILRSKVRLGYNLDSALPYVLPLRALGLLPSLSSLWDLLPSSFIVDWATNTGNSLDFVDTSVLFTAFDILYSTHSVSLVYDFTEEDESTYHFTVVGTDSSGDTQSIAGYKYYARYTINKALPIIGPTILPILGDFGIPDWTTAGALAYSKAS